MEKADTGSSSMDFAEIVLKIMKCLGVEFAPLNIPFRRRLQTLAAGFWFITMVLGGFAGSILAVYLVLFTQYWWLTLLYLFWALVMDRHTSERSGRRNEWMRSWSWWKYTREYFPTSLERVPWMTLDKKKNYLFCCYPHGMLCTGPFMAFGTNYGGFDQFFPNHKTHIITLDQHFSMPFFRELALGLGGCKATAKSISHILNKEEGGNVAILMVGGATEAFYCKPGVYKIIYDKRKGFIKIAIRTGAPLVPVISFGETDLFDQLENPEGSLLRSVQEWLKKYIGLAPAIPVGRGFFQYTFGMIPKRKPVHTIVGQPMEVEKNANPTQEQIDTLHEKFKQHLINLFEEQKYNYVQNPEQTKLEFI